MDIFLNINLIFVAVAILFRIFLPKKKNLLYGYRTTFSRLNNVTWNEANRYFANMFLLFSIISYIIFIIIDLTVSPSVSDKISPPIPVLLLIIAVVKTEKHLRKKFNGDGTEKI